MGRKLWGGDAIGEDTPGLKRSRVNKQKVHTVVICSNILPLSVPDPSLSLLQKDVSFHEK